MRIYRNTTEAITDIGRELKKCSTVVHTQTYQNKVVGNLPEFATKEIQAFDFTVLDTSDKDLMPNVTLDWLRAEFAERVSGQPINPGEAWLLRKEVWGEFINDDLQFDYTYAERMFWQLDTVIKELTLHPETRQAIIEIHNREVDQERMGLKRIPCSMYYQFMLRDGKLDVVYNMRSTDFATHFQNDIWLAAELRNWIAEKIGVQPGKFIMFASSLHIYKKDWDLLKNY